MPRPLRTPETFGMIRCKVLYQLQLQENFSLPITTCSVSIIITARIRRMGEGNVFSLFTSGGGYPYPIMLCNISQNAMGQPGGVPCQVQLGGTLGGYPGWGVPWGVACLGGYPAWGGTLAGGYPGWGVPISHNALQHFPECHGAAGGYPARSSRGGTVPGPAGGVPWLGGTQAGGYPGRGKGGTLAGGYPGWGVTWPGGTLAGGYPGWGVPCPGGYPGWGGTLPRGGTLAGGVPS